MYPDKNVVWLDADAIIEETPILFTKINKSIAAHILEHLNKKEFLTGTLFFKNNTISKKF